MGAAIVAILVKAIPYAMPFVLGVLGWLAKKAWSAIIGKVSNEKVALAMETMAAKATAVVEALEQTMRPALSSATSDGKLTAEEAKNLAKLALENLLGLSVSEVSTLKQDGGMDDTAVERLASTMLEQAVYRLPAKQTNVMTYADKVDALRPPEWQQTAPVK